MFDAERPNRVVTGFSLVGMLVLLAFGYENWVKGMEQVGLIEIGMSVVLAINLALGRLHKRVMIVAYVANIVVLGMLIIMYMTGGIGGSTGVYWYFIFPVIAFYLLDKAGAYILIAGLFMATGGLAFAAELGLVSVAYSVVDTRQLLVSLAIETLLMGLYQKASGDYEREFEAQQARLNSTNIELQKVAELSRASQAELEVKNAEMSKGKLAMLNLLEDAKSLEKQLKEEKASVEKTVRERTSELTAVIDSINRGLVVVNTEREIVLRNKIVQSVIGRQNDCSYAELVSFLGETVGLEKMVTDCFAQKKDFVTEPKLYGAKYLVVHVVPVVINEVVDSVAVFIKDTTEATAMARSRDEFFSIASHELRTPLTAIRGNAGMILDNYSDKLPDKDIVEMLNDIHEGSERLITIVNDFLNVSRLEMGKIEYKIESLKLESVVADVIKEFEVTGSRQKVQIEVKQPVEPLPEVSGDSDRIKQVLINLIGNGLKFTHDGSITVALVQKESGVVVEVSDTGEGIPKELQGLLFHKFQQAGSSLYTRDTSKGTGLGLYISKLMMEGMGGKIWLERSELGKGSTFAFSLPIAKKAQM